MTFMMQCQRLRCRSPLLVAVVAGLIAGSGAITSLAANRGAGLSSSARRSSTQDAAQLRFFAMGDTGTGRPEQHKVASAVFEHCQREGCDFGVLLGDNIYPSGVVSATDAQWKEKFERPYANLLNTGLKFYAVLGNHDYDDSHDLSRGAHQVQYGAAHPNWIMPDERYAFEAGQVTFIALNTELINNSAPEFAIEEKLVRETLGASTKRWKIALGHHPYRSNGPNGNAGPALANLFEQQLCQTVDVYLSGHDHNLQVLKPDDACQTLLVVSGGGGGYATYALPGQNPKHFQAQSLGFAYVTVTTERLQVDILNDSGRVLYSHTLTKRRQGINEEVSADPQ